MTINCLLNRTTDFILGFFSIFIFFGGMNVSYWIDVFLLLSTYSRAIHAVPCSHAHHIFKWNGPIVVAFINFVSTKNITRYTDISTILYLVYQLMKMLSSYMHIKDMFHGPKHHPCRKFNIFAATYALRIKWLFIYAFALHTM